MAVRDDDVSVILIGSRARSGDLAVAVTYGL
jgi:hypothetical protein